MKKSIKYLIVSAFTLLLALSIFPSHQVSKDINDINYENKLDKAVLKYSYKHYLLTLGYIGYLLSDKT